MTRFRRASAPGRSLADIGNLMRTAAAHSPEPSKVATPFGITPNDDDLTCIWKVLSDGKGRTATELMGALAGFTDQVDPDDISGLLQLLVTNGFALRQNNRTDECIYHLKKGITMSMINSKAAAAPSKLRGPQSALEGLTDDGKIDLSEGIYVCIWKVMSDFRRRSQDQIVETLAAYGINREVIMNGFIKVKVSYKWFDWHGTGTNTTYKLKKHIKKPESENLDPAQLKQKQTPGMPVKVASMPGSKLPEFGSGPSAPVYTNKGRRHVETAEPQLFDADQLFDPAIPAINDNEGKAPPPIILRTDALDVAIWKVMSDFNPYTASEVGLLLAEYGHNPGTVRARISQLHLHEGQWFIRDRRKSATSNNYEYLYVLKTDIPMPGLPPEPEKPTELEEQPAPAADPVAATPADTQNDKKETEMTKNPTTNPAMAEALSKAQQNAGAQPPKAANPPAASTPPVAPAASSGDTTADNAGKEFSFKDLPNTDLLKFQVQIRNTPYSFQQVEDLTKELVNQGFGHGKFRTTPQSILQTSYRIGNASFTGNELEDLTQQLTAIGFGDNE